MSQFNGYDCPQSSSWLAGCRYEPRFDRSGEHGRYLGDICTRCGQWLPLDPPDAEDGERKGTPP